MDPILKQRLVGALVLSALAVIFLPMIFEEPGRGMDSRDFEIPEIPIQFKQKTLEKVKNLPEVESTQSDVKPSPLKMIPKDEKIKVKESKNPLSAWVVQVGSFSKNENAILLRDQLRKSGYPAYVQTGKKNDSVLFRVRVGPELDLQRARSQRDKIAKKFSVKAIVIPHP